MKFPFTVIEQGIEFTFERRNCEEHWIEYGPIASWAEKKYYNDKKCFGPWKFVGRGHSATHSQRVGVCRKHKANDFTEATLDEWRNDSYVQKHLKQTKSFLWGEVDRQDIADELGYKRSRYPYAYLDDVVHNTHNDTYQVTLKGLTREEAINFYKMADALKAEREELQ